MYHIIVSSHAFHAVPKERTGVSLRKTSELLLEQRHAEIRITKINVTGEHKSVSEDKIASRIEFPRDDVVENEKKQKKETRAVMVGQWKSRILEDIRKVIECRNKFYVNDVWLWVIGTGKLHVT